MTKEELLQEAKLRYPVGTKFKVVHQPDKIRTVKSHNYFDNTFVGYGRDVAINLLIQEIGGTIGATVYYNGKWAEIIEHSQLLGETEEWEPKVGDWVYAEGKGYYNDDYRSGKYIPLFKVAEISKQSSDNYLRPQEGLSTGVPEKFCRPARPEEIPQEEVEYVECIETTLVNCGAEKGVIYQVIKGGYGVNGKEIIAKGGGRICDLKSPIANINFKPSTREAYEAQQRKQECDCFDGCIKCKNVNKCSTINTNQNGKNESCETKSTLDRNTGAKTGQSIRLRTTGVRIKCKSGLLRSGKEVTRTVKSSPRIKAEIGRRFTKGRS